MAKAIRITVDGQQARYNPAPELKQEGETQTAFLTRIAAEVGGQVVNESDIEYPPTPFALYKTTIIGRMTDEELDTFDEAMGAAPRRQRLMWENCLRVESSDAFFPDLQSAMTAAFGQDRASQILAAE